MAKSAITVAIETYKGIVVNAKGPPAVIVAIGAGAAVVALGVGAGYAAYAGARRLLGKREGAG